MRLWSLHPKYLDAKGLVALWREALLAKKVLEGKTRGYKNHPQLIRFKKSKDPIRAINKYLYYIWQEACRRGYEFDKDKFDHPMGSMKMTVSKGQIMHECAHLKNKLLGRAKKYAHSTDPINPEPNPVFTVKEGNVELWEKIKMTF